MQEVKKVSATGGVRMEKEARWDLIPQDVLHKLAVLLGRGANKYEDRNWEKGYSWSSSYNSAMNHMSAFWAGEDDDEEMGLPHTVCAMFHMAALTRFMTTQKAFDDRPFDEARAAAQPKIRRDAGDVPTLFDDKMKRWMPVFDRVVTDAEKAESAVQWEQFVTGRSPRIVHLPPTPKIEGMSARVVSEFFAAREATIKEKQDAFGSAIENIFRLHAGTFEPGDEETPAGDDPTVLDDEDLRSLAARRGFDWPDQVSRKALLSWLDPTYPADAPWKLHIQHTARARALPVGHLTLVPDTCDCEELDRRNATQAKTIADQMRRLREGRQTIRDLRIEMQKNSKAADELSAGLLKANENLIDSRDAVREQIRQLKATLQEKQIEVDRAKRAEVAAKNLTLVAQNDRRVAAEANESAQRSLREQIAQLEEQLNRAMTHDGQ